MTDKDNINTDLYKEMSAKYMQELQKALAESDEKSPDTKRAVT